MYRGHMEALAGDCWSRNKSGCCDQLWAWVVRKSTFQTTSSLALGTSASEPRSSCLHGKYLAGQLSYSWAQVCGDWYPDARRSPSWPSLSGQGKLVPGFGAEDCKTSGKNVNFSTRRDEGWRKNWK